MSPEIRCKRVRFSPYVTLISEPPELSKFLREARQSDYERRKADFHRLEKLLNKILSPNHREKIYQTRHNQ